MTNPLYRDRGHRPNLYFQNTFGYHDPTEGYRRRDQLPNNVLRSQYRTRVQALSATGRIVRAFVRECRRFNQAGGSSRARLLSLYRLGRRLGFTGRGVQVFLRKLRRGEHGPMIQWVYSRIKQLFPMGVYPRVNRNL